MNKISVLVISIAFPPKNYPESLQTAKYFKHLLENNSINYYVITSANPTLFMPVDRTLPDYEKRIRQLIEVHYFESKYLNYLQRKIIPSVLSLPDSKYRFHKKSLFAIENLKNDPDIIYSRSFPLSSTIMAYKIREHFQVPWVLHLSDPWTLSPVHSIEYAKNWNKEFEEKCLESASLITFTSQKTIDIYVKKYPLLENKMKVMQNVFDISDGVMSKYRPGEKIRIVYTGGLVDDRSPISIIQAFSRLKNRYPFIAEDFDITFAGGLDRKNATHFKSCKHTEIRHIGMISFKKAIELQNDADLLLLIDTPMESEKESQFFPSKLLDYMLAKKRVLAITNKNSTTWQVVKNESLGDAVTHANEKGVVQGLITSWKAWKKKDDTYFTIKRLNMNYSSKLNADRLSQIFLDLYNENK